MDPSIPSSSTSGVESEPVPDPPFKGYIESTFDALLIFEAARAGMIPRVTRRLIDSERGMVQSGAVFVFDEHESGIKRWTDGLSWSPSRILGNFLVSHQPPRLGVPRKVRAYRIYPRCTERPLKRTRSSRVRRRPSTDRPRTRL